MDAFQYIQVTAAFSNAVLNAVLPGVWSFTSHLELDVPERVESAQIASLSVSDRKGRVDGSLVLDSGFRFSFTEGDVHAFSSPRNLFAVEDWSSLDRFAGKARMSEREAIELARQSLRRLGYDPNKILLNRTPDHLEHIQKLPHYSAKDFAFYSMTWKIAVAANHVVILSVMVDAHEKKVCGLYVGGRWTKPPLPELGVEPPIMVTVPLPYAEPERHFFITPAYSNAMLNAVLPLVATVARQLEPSGAVPVLRGQVAQLRLTDTKGQDNGSLTLTNGNLFWFGFGHISGYRSPRDLLEATDFEHLEPFAGKATLTRSEALLFARMTWARLGYDRLRLGLVRPPDTLNYTDKFSTQPKLDFAHYDLVWENEGSGDDSATCSMSVDAHERKVTKFSASSRAFWRPPFKVDVEPPLKPPVIRPLPKKLLPVPNPPDLKAPSQPPKPRAD